MKKEIEYNQKYWFPNDNTYHNFLNTIENILTEYGKQSKSSLIQELRIKGWENFSPHFLNEEFEDILENYFNVTKTYKNGCLRTIHIEL